MGGVWGFEFQARSELALIPNMMYLITGKNKRGMDLAGGATAQGIKHTAR